MRQSQLAMFRTISRSLAAQLCLLIFALYKSQVLIVLAGGRFPYLSFARNSMCHPSHNKCNAPARTPYRLGMGGTRNMHSWFGWHRVSSLVSASCCRALVASEECHNLSYDWLMNHAGHGVKCIPLVLETHTG